MDRRNKIQKEQGIVKNGQNQTVFHPLLSLDIEVKHLNAGREKQKKCNKCSEMAVVPVRYVNVQKFRGSGQCCRH